MDNGVKKIKKSSYLKKTLLILLVVLVLGVIGASIYGFNLINKINKINTTEEDIGINKEATEELSKYNNYDKIINIALFGIDAGENEFGRSDSIMILTIDPIHNKMKLSSIMRDSYVNIEDHGMDKINHAFAFGNSVLALKTLNNNFGLNINNFISTDFSNLPKIIDKLGGIELNITSDELKYINSYIDNLNVLNSTSSPHLDSTGKQLLDGTQCLAYSRIRYTDGGDYERTWRHRTILKGVYDKVKDTKVSELPSLLNDFLPFIETNLGTTELLNIGSTINKIGSSSLIEDRFPRDGYCEGKMIEGVYYLTFDLDTTKQQMKEFIFEN
ncbi:LCP family protein [Clostridium septicum]|uniref:LCP family protein n=1 Tax=Clostridium septicum TaxID=1504 RepID=A0A9N7JLP4_CLOSE|nr:LCP family protein [Clostridium septicum]AYE34868.1 LytR family transcriptional regulator [Clostridium septicum]MDU1314698.1 LCP family protein [Clostridium septicum]QAS60263.1 LytR family transcriptional regulator [Clostridium septicum]UEC20482.1 LCP family protein [Clostridium septicum]USS01462.1 LCP family protein [Clostridium septicum]